MTIREDGTRIRGSKLTEEERAANKHVSFRLNNSIADNVRKLAKANGVTQGAQMQQCIVDGLRMEVLYEWARNCILKTDDVYSEYDIEFIPHEPARHDIPEDLVPSDYECWRFLRRLVSKAIIDYEKEHEQMHL